MTAIPPAHEQLPTLLAGLADLNTRDELEKRLAASHASQRPLSIKAGFDPTAPDIHLGHTVLMEKMAQFQRFGHEVTFLVGDYTARIGDPTGRNAMRPPLTPEQIADNARTYTDQAFKVLDSDKTKIRWNSEWLSKLGFDDVIRIASMYNVGRMLERRDFKERFDTGKQIALHEFLYPLVQGYDSVVMRSDVELGGHDQIFNLNVGRHLMSRYELEPQIVMTVGLLIGLDGVEKMSKSKGNAIGITEPPRDMFGKVMSISDTLMADWYPPLLGKTADASDPNGSKQSLAEQIVARFHGASAAAEVLAWWRAGRPVDEVHELRAATGPIYQVVREVGAATSGGDARRKIEQGGVRLGGERVGDPMWVVAPGRYELEVGKKFKVRLVVE
ncbi:MAG TPA: tyrosine--tRNA ligase [Polyangiaceae bacterium]|nr:tyrosine--tRNA ligase [Polyangiaceae bacterium]